MAALGCVAGNTRPRPEGNHPIDAAHISPIARAVCAWRASTLWRRTGTSLAPGSLPASVLRHLFCPWRQCRSAVAQTRVPRVQLWSVHEASRVHARCAAGRGAWEVSPLFHWQGEARGVHRADEDDAVGARGLPHRHCASERYCELRRVRGKEESVLPVGERRQGDCLTA